MAKSESVRSMAAAQQCSYQQRGGSESEIIAA